MRRKEDTHNRAVENTDVTRAFATLKAQLSPYLVVRHILIPFLP